MDFKSSLRRLIADRNISRKDLEIKAGLYPRALEPYLDRNTEPNLGVAKKLADALGVSLDRLNDYEWVEGQPSQEIQDLINMMDELDADDYYTVSSMIGLLYRKEKYQKQQASKKEVVFEPSASLENIGDEMVVGRTIKHKVHHVGENNEIIKAKEKS